jgi:NAD(P)-dependent dehydrogenase (short-subunit alcohol dehydrogenase family)
MSTSSDLAGRRVVVTGGSGALGTAVVQALTAAGATVVAPGRGEVELTDEASVAAFYARQPDLWASVHVAGGYAGAPFTDTSLADFRRQIDMNLTTCFLCCREAARAMRASGGRIINVASRAAVHPAGGSVAYTVAKAGVTALTQALADELKDAPHKILVNAVLPSTIDTPANRAAMPAADHDRWPKPAAIASAIVWLASPANELVSGALLPVYGQA